MTWEETIKYIRTQPDFKDLIDKAYFEEDLKLNVERFKQSSEFTETLKILQTYQPNAKTLLDIGSGNGISAVAFALNGFDVVAIEPDPSDTIGAGAIRNLKEYYNLENLDVYEVYAEELGLPNERFDIVYARQCMHHAYNLDKFVEEASRVLKKGGLFITVRDHVVFNENDKKWFLENHPLQKYYGGENAFQPIEYRNAIEQAGLRIEKEIKYFENVINFFPFSEQEISNRLQIKKTSAVIKLNKKLGFLSKNKLIQNLYFKRLGINENEVFNENQVPGRMYSYIALKI